MFRLITATVLGFTLLTAPVFAADAADATTVPSLTINAATVAAVANAEPAANADFNTSVVARIKRPSALPALYVGSIALQGYDAYSTLSVLKAGGREANPLMQQMVKNPTAFVAMKASVAAVSILAAEKMWKSGNRLGAVGVMVASNVAMSLVAANNAKVMSSLK